MSNFLSSGSVFDPESTLIRLGKTLDEVVLFSLCSNSFSGLFLKIPVVLQVQKLNLSKDPTPLHPACFLFLV